MPKKLPKRIVTELYVPATTPEGQESMMISLATKLAEQQLRDGTASSQVITHYLKLGTRKEELELAKIQSDIELAKAKKEALESQKAIEALYNEAIKVMKDYSGREDPDSEDIQ